MLGRPFSKGGNPVNRHLNAALAAPIIAAIILALTSPAVSQGPDCTAIPGLPPLESDSVGEQPLKVRVEALLHDAERVYREYSHAVSLQPETESEVTAILKMEQLHLDGEAFQWDECFLQNAYFNLKDIVADNYQTSPSDAAAESLSDAVVRVGQFDNFIFAAGADLISCNHPKADFDLKLSRQLLDHGWIEFRGNTAEWDPEDLDGPQTAATCADDIPLGAGIDDMDVIVKRQITKYTAIQEGHSSSRPTSPLKDCSALPAAQRTLDCRP
jgi:hypothetical protein